MKPSKIITRQFAESLKRDGIPCTVDGFADTCVIREFTDITTQDNKYFYILKGHVNQGAVIELLNAKFIAIQKEVTTNNSYDKAIIRLVNANLKFLYGTVIKQTPAIIENVQMGSESNQTIVMLNGKISVSVPDNPDNRLIQINQRFIFGGRAFKVEGYDRSRLGLIKLTCCLDAISPTDDLVNSIANGLSIPQPEPTPPVGALTITGDITLKQGRTNVYTANVPVDWTIANKDISITTALAVIVSADGLSCSLQRSDSLSGNIGRYITLTATEKTNSGNLKSVDIKIMGLF